MILNSYLGGNGVSLPSNLNGVPSISPQVISGVPRILGEGDGVLTKLKPPILGVSGFNNSFPSTPILPSKT